MFGLTENALSANGPGSTSNAQGTMYATTAKRRRATKMGTELLRPLLRRDVTQVEARFAYNLTLFSSRRLAYFIPKFYGKLPRDVTHLLSRGASGCSLGAGLALYAGLQGRDLRHLNFRKGGEKNSAHSPIGGWSSYDFTHSVGIVTCIVDDFICSGGTITEILRAARHHNVTVPKYILVDHVDSYDVEDDLKDRFQLITVQGGLFEDE